MPPSFVDPTITTPRRTLGVRGNYPLQSLERVTSPRVVALRAS
jgi:hypothetical protein